MSYYASWVLACSAGRLLVDVPEVKATFGSSWLRLERRGEGWQLMAVRPFDHQWPIVGASPESLAVATGGPVLAGWVSESSCVRLVAATPGGRSWSKHLLAYAGLDGGPCGYDHRRFAALRIAADAPDPAAGDTQDVRTDLLSWAKEAGLDADIAAVDGVLTSRDLDSHDRFRSLADALGAPDGEVIEPLFDHQELAWAESWNLGWLAGKRVSSNWTARLRGYDGDEYMDGRPWDVECIAFVEQVAASTYGTGLSYQELVALSQQLQDRWAEAAYARRPRQV